MSKDKQTLSIAFILGITTSLVGLVLLIVWKISRPTYSCGPHLITYSVSSLSNIPGQGVRCVGFIPASPSSTDQSDPIGIFWYGEGAWVKKQYRHIGEVIYGEDGLAGDLFDAEQGFTPPTVNVSVDPDGEGRPKTIRVTGSWNEEWTLETDGKVSGYVSDFSAIKTCGDNFEPFNSISLTDGKYIGIRCKLKDARVWYGEENKDTYIGFILDDNGTIGAFEMCDFSPHSESCNHFNFGSSVFKEVPGQGFRLEPNPKKGVERSLEEEWIFLNPKR